MPDAPAVRCWSTWTCTRVAMAILRHPDFSITMEIYSQVLIEDDP
ncbi:hypothetical protein JOD64_005416 [Micromonospora luteifusca]|uniref:Uncharacterized protein n=1 Tax=Micromonospora luteifusca TaxID=709860 RepID=A0ABS2M2S8_9ACTN|nr:hypothetical protein [Micromonospora luteifusca]